VRTNEGGADVKALKEIRRRRGMSQQELSRATGVAQNTISEIERGHREPQAATLRKLSKALDVEIAEFFKGGDLPKARKPRPDAWGRGGPPGEGDRTHPRG
jgi:transcriptional regulator with XRE-family HTH domain